MLITYLPLTPVVLLHTLDGWFLINGIVMVFGWGTCVFLQREKRQTSR